MGFGIKKDGSVVILSNGKSKYKYENALPFLENIADVISYEPPSEAAAEGASALAASVAAGAAAAAAVVAGAAEPPQAARDAAVITAIAIAAIR